LNTRANEGIIIAVANCITGCAWSVSLFHTAGEIQYPVSRSKNMGLIRADDLEQWASSIAGRNKLGELVRRLVHASIPLESIRRIRFLSDEANQLPDWDGALDCDSKIPWVPNGTSVWELGAGRNTRGKIRDDFRDRREKELYADWSRSETTFVAVTRGKLADVDTFENELKADSPWKDVKILDSQSLAEWIEKFPSAQAWLQDQSVGPPSTVHTLEYVWKEWSEQTGPFASAKLVLAGREDTAQEFRAALRTHGGVTNLQADSPGEAVAFVFAAIDSESDELRRHVLDASIVVTREEDAQQLRDFPPQCVVLRPPATAKAQLLASFGHTVINALGNSAETRKRDYRLRRALANQFTKALVEMGLTQEQAEIESRACGRSPAVWRIWKLQEQADVSSEIPGWAKPEHADKVVPAVLLGGWSESFEGDKEIIAAIAGQDFNTYRDQLHPYISMDDPLLTRAGDASVVTAPAAAFALIVRHITRGHIEKLSEAVIKVFSEVDPTIEIRPEERPFASLRTGGLRHSAWLRDGLAETLLRIVVIGHPLEDTGAIPANRQPQDFVDQLIRQLPGLSEDWRLLTSLRDQLPVLAEAAPSPFLETLEHLLQGPAEKILPIFAEDDGLFGRANHPALWWALETLAWEPDYLGRVSLVLARFAKIDPGGKLTNRPINSLRGIFLAWYPGTSADLKQRLQALDAILQREPEVAWTLLLGLMPHSHDHASPAREPLWKDFSRSQRATLTRGMVLQAYEEYIDRAISHAGTDPHRCRQLVQFYSEVRGTHREAIEESLKALATTHLRDDERDAVWNTLRAFINRHRQFADAAWALPSNQLQRLDDIRDLFASTDLITRFGWLFNHQLPDLPLSSTNFIELDAERDRLRREAVEEIWRDGGIALVMDLADNVLYPGYVSPHLLEVLPGEADVLMVVEKASQGSPNQRFLALCLSGDAYRRFGPQWTKMVTSASYADKWSPQTIANAFVNYPDSLETFDLVSSLGPNVEREFWQAKRFFYHGEDSETIQRTVEKLMAVGRALDVVELTSQRLAVLGPQEILKILDQCLVEMNEGKTSRLQGAVYWIEELFEWLRQREDVDRTELARREYAFLPLLTHGHATKNLALHELLSTDPKFFVDVICDLYKPSSQDQQPLSDEGRRRAEFAWELLRSWRRPPGVHEGTQVSGAELRDWVTKARLLASERDRKIVADQHIGNVLFYYPSDPTDSAWPHVELRRLLEELGSDDIEHGIEMSQFNSRGVVTKALLEGGAQERSVAATWRERAKTVGPLWQRTSSMLERIAESWERFAADEDERAEKERLRSG
jgi:hypothetical protein